ncbi:putative per-hexamer repeat protein 5 [Macrobrachium rosenbergii]|uniref:putative per-hexamer repeat protein 5 n=1 Tax=Macrobrachium rosenbergii TaxID=79674 RepID=UPI0034D684DB
MDPSKFRAGSLSGTSNGAGQVKRGGAGLGSSKGRSVCCSGTKAGPGTGFKVGLGSGTIIKAGPGVQLTIEVGSTSGMDGAWHYSGLSSGTGREFESNFGSPRGRYCVCSGTGTGTKVGPGTGIRFGD